MLTNCGKNRAHTCANVYGSKKKKFLKKWGRIQINDISDPNAIIIKAKVLSNFHIEFTVNKWAKLPVHPVTQLDAWMVKSNT